MDVRALRGACSCGRNHYVVEIPHQRHPSELDVLLDNSSTTRRHHASPMTAFLRVPITWYHSTTFAFFPDETHSSIRRTYTDPSVPDTRRQFCGYCGTQLNTWTERRKQDAEFISLTLGSIFDEDMGILDEIGVLPSGEDEDEEEKSTPQHQSAASGQQLDPNDSNAVILPPSSRHVLGRGTPWFEEMIEHSGLGRVKRQRGGHVSDDGTTRFDYEIIEVKEEEGGDGTTRSTTAKRKWESDGGEKLLVTNDNDATMSGALGDD